MSTKPKQFCIRVYGCALHNREILVLREKHNDKKFLKFPGGGVELGEGLHEALIREWKEELGADIKIVKHLYTQDFFQESFFNPEDHILIVYYQVEILNIEKLQTMDLAIESFSWTPLDIEENPMLLPIDKLVFELLKAKQ